MPLGVVTLIQIVLDAFRRWPVTGLHLSDRVIGVADRAADLFPGLTFTHAESVYLLPEKVRKSTGHRPPSVPYVFRNGTGRQTIGRA